MSRDYRPFLDDIRRSCEKVLRCTAGSTFEQLMADWISPLAREDYREYRDDFLSVLGLAQYYRALRDFWPLWGPQWDGLALLSGKADTGVLLIEAKAHPAETASAGRAANQDSATKIEAAFAQAQRHMGVAPCDWMRVSYQLANRLAFLYVMNEIAKVPTFLALVNFVDDRSHKPTSLAEWRAHYQVLFPALGIHPGCRMLDRIFTVFLPA